MFSTVDERIPVANVNGYALLQHKFSLLPFLWQFWYIKRLFIAALADEVSFNPEGIRVVLSGDELSHWEEKEIVASSNELMLDLIQDVTVVYLKFLRKVLKQVTPRK
jgi:hypothetical protein